MAFSAGRLGPLEMTRKAWLRSLAVGGVAAMKAASAPRQLSIEVFFDTFSGGGGNIDFALHSDGGNVPGAILFTTSAAFGSNTALDWHGVSALNWAVVAGTYWVSFHPDSNVGGSMPGTAPNPLDEYAQGFGAYSWQDEGPDFFDYLDIGIRIDASDASNVVSEPVSLALLGVGLAGLGFSRRKRAR